MPNTKQNPAAIIAKKRDHGELSRDEIYFMVDGFTAGAIADYQMSAWAMAVLCRGMSEQETAVLTEAMLASGTRLTRVTERPRVDKHSTGGLGDKISLVLAPLLACFDVEVPMLSGPGLGITGGTLDKLEAFPSFNCQLTQAQITSQLKTIGCVITGATADVAPADRKLYSLRDVTGTVPSIALITSSIMSKKLAATLDALVLDVKFGSAAFMRELSSARQLAQALTATGNRMGVPTSAVLSDMHQPLGRMVGNACEVNEALAVLRGAGPDDVRALTLHLAAQLLTAVGLFETVQAASVALGNALDTGHALERFEAMVVSQGGQFSEKLPVAPGYDLLASQSGWMSSLDGQLMGQVVIELGGGRQRLSDAIDHSVGLEMLVRIGDPVSLGQPLVRVLAGSPAAAEQAIQALTTAIRIAPEPVLPNPLIVEL
jgi:pyrimidine-nucleoside phosphorylase